MKKHPLFSLPIFALSICLSTTNVFAAYAYNLNVEIIQVRADDGSDGAPLVSPASGGGSYVYESQIQEIYDQANIQVTFIYSTWDNTAAQQLTSAERSALYGNTFAAGSGDPSPGLGADALQIFYVWDHPGTGGTWKAEYPTYSHNTRAKNAGNAQLFIDGTYSSNGRSVIANMGFTADSLSNTLAHEIGHTLGLRHAEDVNGGAGNGTTQDPNYTILVTDQNMMWGGGQGPNYNSSLNNDPSLTVLQENSYILPVQIDAAIYNGLRLDPDGNGIGVLQAIPEPSTLIFSFVGLGALMLRRKRS